MSPLRVLAVAAASLALVVPAGAAAAPSHPDVRVMSRNLYLGADIITAATASNPEELTQRAAALFGVVRQTNFPLRAQAIAREIRTTRPDLIGLQEVALWRRTAPGVTNDVRDARVVVYDFLALLRRALAARGLRYRAAVVQREADFEVPTSLGFDLRLTMRDVILVRTAKRARVQIRRTRKGTYASLLTVGLPTGPRRQCLGPRQPGRLKLARLMWPRQCGAISRQPPLWGSTTSRKRAPASDSREPRRQTTPSRTGGSGSTMGRASMRSPSSDHGR